MNSYDCGLRLFMVTFNEQIAFVGYSNFLTIYSTKTLGIIVVNLTKINLEHLSADI